MVNRAMKNLQEQKAVVEESHQPAALGNRVTMDFTVTSSTSMKMRKLTTTQKPNASDGS